MKHKEPEFERKGHLIIDLNTKKVTEHNSIAEAKRASRKLQMNADGALGRGTVRVVR